MGTLLILAGLIGLIVGVVSLVRPIQSLRIATRKQAGVVIAASFVIVMIGGALSPADAGNQSAPPTSSFDTSASTSTDGPDTSSSGDQPATTTTTDAVTTTTLAATSTTGAPGTELPTQGTGVEVVEVVDGDTVVVRFDDGAIDTVRLIGINTPERDECYAAEATDALGDLILGRRVGLTVDATDRDIYDRLLRYIWVGDTHVNEQLVAGGYAIARRYRPIPPTPTPSTPPKPPRGRDLSGCGQRTRAGRQPQPRSTSPISYGTHPDLTATTSTAKS